MYCPIVLQFESFESRTFRYFIESSQFHTLPSRGTSYRSFSRRLFV